MVQAQKCYTAKVFAREGSILFNKESRNLPSLEREASFFLFRTSEALRCEISRHDVVFRILRK